MIAHRLSASAPTIWVEELERQGWCVFDLVVTPPSLADDSALTVEREEISADGRRQPILLADRMSEAELAAHQEKLVRLLQRIAGNAESAVLFLSATTIDDDADDDSYDRFRPPEEFLSLRACFDRGRINGEIAVVRAGIQSLRRYESAFGRYDRVRGLITSRAFRDVVNALSLGDPLPSTEPESLLGSHSRQPLLRVLQQGEVFFEEVFNGTRLRLIARQGEEERIVSASDALTTE